MNLILEIKSKHAVRGYPATRETPEEVAYVEATITKIETEDFCEEGQQVSWNSVEGEGGSEWEVEGTIGKRLDSNGDEGPFIYEFSGTGITSSGRSDIL